MELLFLGGAALLALLMAGLVVVCDKRRVQGRIASLQAADPGNKLPIPVDLLTAPGSGLDPHISVAGANYQAARIARLRGVPLAQVQALIGQAFEGQLLGFLGEPRVNVLRVNLAVGALRS